MKTFKDEISLNKNARGCYILDTIKGCGSCAVNKNGCYDECYAAKIANRYKFNFSELTKRNIKENDNQIYMFGFKNEKNQNKLIKQIKKIDMPFIRIGEMGDPSEDWEHTINVCKIISKAKKQIVIISKHWKTIPDNLLEDIKEMDICINTSISALDTSEQIQHRLNQFFRLKKYCKSVLRIVSCDFNKENEEGLAMSITQEELFKNDKTIDTIFRVSLNNRLVKNEIINIEKVKFLSSNVWASIYNKDTFFGLCSNCNEMCGVNL